MNLTEYAKHIGVTPNAVRKAIESGRIRKAAYRVGGLWHIDAKLADQLWTANTTPRVDHPMRGKRHD